MTEGHTLLAGVYKPRVLRGSTAAPASSSTGGGANLRTECLYDPLGRPCSMTRSGWDLGSSLFRGRYPPSFRLQTSAWPTCPKRPVAMDAKGYYISANGDRLRLFHFHAFDSQTPERLSVRFRHTN